MVKMFYINIILSYMPNIEKSKFADFGSMVSSKCSIDKFVRCHKTPNKGTTI